MNGDWWGCFMVGLIDWIFYPWTLPPLLHERGYANATAADLHRGHGMSDQVCPHCGSEVSVAGRTTHFYVCPRCGPVDPVEPLTKVFQGGGPLLGGKVEGECASCS